MNHYGQRSGKQVRLHVPGQAVSLAKHANVQLKHTSQAGHALGTQALCTTDASSKQFIAGCPSCQRPAMPRARDTFHLVCNISHMAAECGRDILRANGPETARERARLSRRIAESLFVECKTCRKSPWDPSQATSHV